MLQPRAAKPGMVAYWNGHLVVESWVGDLGIARFEAKDHGKEIQAMTVPTSHHHEGASGNGASCDAWRCRWHCHFCSQEIIDHYGLRHGDCVKFVASEGELVWLAPGELAGRHIVWLKRHSAGFKQDLFNHCLASFEFLCVLKHNVPIKILFKRSRCFRCLFKRVFGNESASCMHSL